MYYLLHDVFTRDGRGTIRSCCGCVEPYDRRADDDDDDDDGAILNRRTRQVECDDDGRSPVARDMVVDDEVERDDDGRSSVDGVCLFIFLLFDGTSDKSSV